ncbi:MAG TPA: hypothetical protein VFQ80_10320 [Thermomicrobiales bacterium]|nr:hypothetical protein [Thermomicrobiales bacterium]
MTSPGGVGKARLALAFADDVAARFPDGVAFVDLGSVREPALVPAAAAAAVDLQPRPNHAIASELARHLRPRQMLLLFDTCEHVAGATAALAAGLLAACPRLQILATSRSRLRVRSERVMVVEPLPSPPADESWEQTRSHAAVQLFVERATAATPGFALTLPTRPRSPPSAAASTACRSPSSWPPAAAPPSPPKNCWRRWEAGFATWARLRAISRRGSTRCAPRSVGVMTA